MQRVCALTSPWVGQLVLCRLHQCGQSPPRLLPLPRRPPPTPSPLASTHAHSGPPMHTFMHGCECGCGCGCQSVYVRDCCRSGGYVRACVGVCAATDVRAGRRMIGWSCWLAGTTSWAPRSSRCVRLPSVLPLPSRPLVHIRTSIQTDVGVCTDARTYTDHVCVCVQQTQHCLVIRPILCVDLRTGCISYSVYMNMYACMCVYAYLCLCVCV
jgi:hypothetical protein